MLTGRTPGALSVEHPLKQLSIQTAQEGFVADFIMPPFTVRNRQGSFLRWSRATTHRVYNDRVAKGERPKEIELDAIKDTFSCEEYALGQAINRIDIEESDLADLRSDSVVFLTNAHALAREFRVAAIAGNTTIVPNATAAAIAGSGFAWSNVNGTPITDILAAKALVQTRTQRIPNRIVMTYPTMIAMITTTNWRDTYRFTEVGIQDRIFEAFNGLRAMGLEPRLAGTCGLTTEQGTPSDPELIEAIWGSSVLVYYAVPRPTVRTECFGFQPNTRIDELLRIDSGRDKEAEIVERWTIRSSVDELIVNANCGELITNTIV